MAQESRLLQQSLYSSTEEYRVWVLDGTDMREVMTSGPSRVSKFDYSWNKSLLTLLGTGLCTMNNQPWRVEEPKLTFCISRIRFSVSSVAVLVVLACMHELGSTMRAAYVMFQQRIIDMNRSYTTDNIFLVRIN
jgi:hypothetical protein